MMLATRRSMPVACSVTQPSFGRVPGRIPEHLTHLQEVMMKRFRTLVLGLVLAPLAFGAWTALPGSADAGLRCTLPGPCGDCMKRCMEAGYPNGGSCDEVLDCCACLH